MRRLRPKRDNSMVKRDSMKKDQQQSKTLVRQGWQIGILSVVAIVALIASILNAVGLQKAMGSSTIVYISDITREMAKAISDTIGLKKADLMNIADSMGKENVFSSERETADFMCRKAVILGFDAMVLIDREGEYILSSNLDEEMEVDPETLFSLDAVQDAFGGKTTTSYIGDQNLYYTAPVWRYHEAQYVLVGIRSKENMQSMIAAKSFNGKCLNCIIDSEENLVLAPTDMRPFEQLGEIFKEGSDEVRQDIVAMQEKISEGEAGVFKFTSIDGKRNYLSYNSLNVNDWVLMTIVPENVISSSTERYILRSFILIGGIVLTLAAFWLVIYRMYNSNRKELMEIAFVDPLTMGMNNKAFQLKYQETADMEDMSEYAVVLMDVRNFKLVNESFGIKVGNEMLCYIYQVINRHMREGNGEFAARSETDHFFLCIRENEEAGIQARLDEIIEDINAFRDTECPHYQMSFRQGACLVKDKNKDIAALQDRARVASQKEIPVMEQGCVFYDESITEKIKKEQELDALFEESFRNHDFMVYLQPKVGLRDGSLKGAEALIRWKHPDRGMIFPSDFIPLFENNGKICRLDLYVFEETCQMLSRRKKEGKDLFPVSVNLSRQHFYYPNFLEEFDAVFRKYDIPYEVIEFEITESIFLDDAQLAVVKETIQEMHRMGFRCSLDDFGSGFSSLGLLREFDVDTLKMDRRFFLDISSRKARDVIQCVVELAKKLHVKTVAEGIEVPEQLEYLRSIQCDEIQGYIFSRPLPIPEFEEWETHPELRKEVLDTITV